MSERITGELRRAMRIGYAVEDGEQVDAIRHGAFMDQCAAIDSIHANLERENDRLKCELDRVLGELDDVHKTDGISDNTSGFMQNAEHHAWAPESHYVMLPKDADGEPIHIGDVVDEKLPFGGYAAPAPIDTMELSRGASGYRWMVKLDAENRALISPKLLRHHHADSWERIIKDAINASESDELGDGSYEQAVTALVARCKALAGGVE